MDDTEIRAALRQQLRSDRLFGLTSVPVERASGLSPLGLKAEARPAPGPSAEAVADKAEQLRVLDETQVSGCQKCILCKTRSRTVFGQGNPAARLVFVGEAPGYEEDRQGLAFVGRAGQLLTRMITAMGLTREEVFICNVLKCRPPGNRDPSADEILACGPYLRRQLSIIEPEVLVALGSPAAKTLLNTTQPIGRLRGRFHNYDLSELPGQRPTIPLMPTYHPAYLLRNPAEKRKTWDDLRMVMAQLSLPPESTSSSRRSLRA